MPERVAVWGEPVASSATEMEALNVVAAAGVKVTDIEQAADTASDVPQLFVCAKLLAPVPVTEIPMMFSVAPPGFDSVMVCDAVVTPTALEKVRLLGESTACGVGAAVPVPFSVTLWPPSTW